eukprot:4310425-Pleurochrysis_carterae.AAC.1
MYARSSVFYIGSDKLKDLSANFWIGGEMCIRKVLQRCMRFSSSAICISRPSLIFMRSSALYRHCCTFAYIVSAYIVCKSRDERIPEEWCSLRVRLPRLIRADDTVTPEPCEQEQTVSLGSGGDMAAAHAGWTAA